MLGLYKDHPMRVVAENEGNVIIKEFALKVIAWRNKYKEVGAKDTASINAFIQVVEDEIISSEHKQEQVNPIDKIIPGHWTIGGTGLTNFDPSEYELYLKAITEYGDDTFVISTEPYNKPVGPDNAYSLHKIDRIGRFRDCSDFWKTFYKIKSEMKRR